MRVKNENARKFYEIEATNNQWNVRFLGSTAYQPKYKQFHKRV
jgi:predicted nuclease of restriction endonuclease-like (RecB) superfamily